MSIIVPVPYFRPGVQPGKDDYPKRSEVTLMHGAAENDSISLQLYYASDFVILTCEPGKWSTHGPQNKKEYDRKKQFLGTNC